MGNLQEYIHQFRTNADYKPQALQREAAYISQRLRQINGEARSGCTVDHAMIIGQRQRQHQARYEFAVLINLLHA